MTIEDMVRLIERDRRRRESGVALMLLALATKARRYVNRAIRVGSSWAGVLRGVLLGNPALDLPGGVPPVSRAMADSHAAGLRRVGRLAGLDLPPADTAALAQAYQPRASEVLTRAADAIEREANRAINEAVGADSIHADVLAAGEGFRAAGWATDASASILSEATGVVTASYAAGMAEGFRAGPVQLLTSGLRFVNPLDAMTTDICRGRAGVKLPLDHPWLFRNWPPLHWGCRSLMLPIGGRVDFTENPPEFPPPEPGWGHWAGILSARS